MSPGLPRLGGPDFANLSPRVGPLKKNPHACGVGVWGDFQEADYDARLKDSLWRSDYEERLEDCRAWGSQISRS